MKSVQCTPSKVKPPKLACPPNLNVDKCVEIESVGPKITLLEDTLCSCHDHLSLATESLLQCPLPHCILRPGRKAKPTFFKNMFDAGKKDKHAHLAEMDLVVF